MAGKGPVYVTSMPMESVAMDVEAFDNLIASHGIQFVHYKALPCPIGITDEFDMNSHSDHLECSNGFIYEESGTLTALMRANGNAGTFDDIGIVDGATIQVTLPRNYDGTQTEVSLQNFDRFYMKDYTGVVGTSQKFVYNQTGLNRLRFPAVSVEFLMDNNGKRYKQDIDFVLVDGNINWISQNRPEFNPAIQKGAVCSVRFNYKPFWYVKNVLHEVRVAKAVDDITGESRVIRMPQEAIFQREIIFENQDRDEKNPNNPRSVQQPRKLTFGQL